MEFGYRRYCCTLNSVVKWGILMYVIYWTQGQMSLKVIKEDYELDSATIGHWSLQHGGDRIRNAMMIQNNSKLLIECKAGKASFCR